MCKVRHYYQHFEHDGAEYMYYDWDQLDHFITSPRYVPADVPPMILTLTLINPVSMHMCDVDR